MEFPNNFKDLRKLGVRNIALYSAANVSFFSIYTHFFHTLRHVDRRAPAKRSLDLVPRWKALRMIVMIANGRQPGFCSETTVVIFLKKMAQRPRLEKYDTDQYK